MDRCMRWNGCRLWPKMRTDLKAWTEKCRKDVRKWFDDDLERVGDLILALAG